MNLRTKTYAAAVVMAGLAILAAALWSWSSPAPQWFLVYLTLGTLSSVLKVRLPGMTGTMSLSFMVILIGVAEFSFSETIAAACVAALAQSLWRATVRPRLIQVLFNMSTLALSSAVTYWAARAVLRMVNAEDVILLLILSAMLFLLINTGLVATILGWSEAKPVLSVWRECYHMAFPYFAMGTLVAGLICSTLHSLGWSAALLLLPAAVLNHVYYKTHLSRWVSRHAG